MIDEAEEGRGRSVRGEASSSSMRSPSSGVSVSCEALSSASSAGETVSRSQPASATISRVLRNEAAMISVPTVGRPHLRTRAPRIFTLRAY